MNKIFFTSDLHFCHDRRFIYEPRGFSSVEEMNETIIKNFNSLIDNEDDLYILGDLMLKDDVHGMECLNALPGRKHIILGNHDSKHRRSEYYPHIRGFVDMKWADMLEYNGYHFFLSHFPSMTGNLEKESLKQVICSLSGHTHSKDKFYQDIPFLYNVALDAHNCYPIEIEEIIHDMWIKVKECKEML